MKTTFSLLFIYNIILVSSIEPKKFLLILLDGFASRYLDHMPKNGGFQTLISEGVMAEYVRPVFPSESYPGYYKIATGLNGENNGFVSNIMYDKKTDSVFQYLPDDNSEKSFWWEQAEPIWITTTKNNISTGSFRWPGGNVPNHGVTPKIATPFEKQIISTLGKDVDKVLDLLVKDEIQFAQVYSQFPDTWGHLLGPVITQYTLTPWVLDPVFKSMLKKIRENGLENSLNIIVVSDHGMARSDMFAVKTLHLRAVLNPDDVTRVLYDETHTSLIAQPGKEQKVYDDLKKLGPGTEVYWKKDLPERYHVKNSDRVLDIVVIMKKGYFLDGLHGSKKQTPEDAMTWAWEGYHGWDPTDYPEMNAIFIGWGPDFKKGEKFPPIDIVDSYNLICRLNGIKPLPNNGTWSHVKDMITL